VRVPRYLIERSLGEVSRDALERIVARSTRIREERFPQIAWEHTHVVRSPDGLKAFCLYESPDAESVRAHAEALGLPAERLFEVETDLAPPAT
jgi:hypothetical protein